MAVTQQLQRACNTITSRFACTPVQCADTGKKGLQSTKRTPRSKIESKKGARRVKGASRRWHRSIFARARDTHTLCSRARPRRHPSLPLSSRFSLVHPLVRIRGSRFRLLFSRPSLHSRLHTRRRPPGFRQQTFFAANSSTFLPRARLHLPITTSTTPSTARPIYLSALPPSLSAVHLAAASSPRLPRTPIPTADLVAALPRL